MGNCSAKGASVSSSATGASFEDDGGEGGGKSKDIMKGGVGGGGGGGAMGDEEVGFKKLEVLQSPEKGVWRVRVAIKSEQWAKILKEQANTEAMIERMRWCAAQQQKQSIARATCHCDQLMVLLCKIKFEEYY